MTVSGTGDHSSESETFYGDICSFTTSAASTVTTGSASNKTSSSATVSASYANVVTGTYAPQTVYFKYGTSSGNLNQTAYYSGSISSASGSFSVNVESLSASTTYYYKAYMEVWNGSEYVDISGSVQSFTTEAAPQLNTDYLTDYGMPDVSGLNPTLAQTGTYSEKEDTWYRYTTSNNNRQIAVHTYNSVVNYVVLYDGNNRAPLWTAHTMNNTTWPRNSVGRNESWGNDPAITLTQQSGVSGYSKGHLVASNYRQTAVAQNKQTFYYSNQAPQYQDGFNSGVWSTLEERVVTVSTTGTTMLYVITGVLYEGTVQTISNVRIPSHFYKCIMQCTFSGNTVTGAKGIAFVYTNESHSGSKYYDSAFVTTIDAIEQRAGFDFFATVPTSYQNSAESNTNHSWFTGVTTQNSIPGINDNTWGSF